jgi:cyclophilin family peptidyl-prolyl cis-trans isomerase
MLPPSIGLRALLLLSLRACLGMHETNFEGKLWLAANEKKDGVKVTASGLQYRVIKAAAADAPQMDSSTDAICHFEGFFTNGTSFDKTSREPDYPRLLKFSTVIDGFREAMSMMRENDDWELVLPPYLYHHEEHERHAIYPTSAKTAAHEDRGMVLVYRLHIVKIRSRSWAQKLTGRDMKHTDLYTKIMVTIPFILLALLWHRGFGHKGRRVSLQEASDPANPRVFFQISINGEATGRIEFELFRKVCPRTVENFRCMCTGERGKMNGKPLHYKGSTFHSITKQFKAQGGDIGGQSIYGGRFDDEWGNGVVQHSKAGLLSMANAGPNTNGSQFMLTLAKAPHLDDRHVVFGQVVHGMDVVKKIEAVGLGKSRSTCQPNTSHGIVVIDDCGDVRPKDD